MLQALSAEPLDAGSEHFQPSELVITSVDVGNPASNLIPAEARASFNIRFNDRHTARKLETALRARLDATGGDYRLEYKPAPRRSSPCPAPSRTFWQALIERELGIVPELSTTGGTSDARFIKDVCPVVEFGLVGATIHQVDERVPVPDLEALTRSLPGPARQLRQTGLMPDREEVLSGLYGAYRLAWFDPSGMAHFNLRSRASGARSSPRCWSPRPTPS